MDSGSLNTSCLELLPPSKIGHTLSPKRNSDRFKRFELIPSIFSNHGRVNLEIKSSHKQKGSQKIIGN